MIIMIMGHIVSKTIMFVFTSIERHWWNDKLMKVYIVVLSLHL